MRSLPGGVGQPVDVVERVEPPDSGLEESEGGVGVAPEALDDRGGCLEVATRLLGPDPAAQQHGLLGDRYRYRATIVGHPTDRHGGEERWSGSWDPGERGGGRRELGSGVIEPADAEREQPGEVVRRDGDGVVNGTEGHRLGGELARPGPVMGDPGEDRSEEGGVGSAYIVAEHVLQCGQLLADLEQGKDL